MKIRKQQNYNDPEVAARAIKRFLKDLDREGINYDDKDVVGIQNAFKLGFLDDSIRAKYNIRTKLLKIFRYDKKRENKDYYNRIKSSNRHVVTLESLMLVYGNDEGMKRWNNYRKKQAETNTFEYKHKKYGMSKAQFDEYNANRAVTLDNLIKRHGLDKGKDIWNNYRKRQAYAGCKLEYFLEKYGDSGRKIYDELCRRKTHTIESVMERSGVNRDKAIEILEDYYKRALRGSYSDISQKLFWDVYNGSEPGIRDSTYFGELNQEFGKWSNELDTYVKYDFTINQIKLIVEFNGDYWHANPKKYQANDNIRFPFGETKSAKTIWDYDDLKLQTVKKLGYDVIVIWESDYRNNPTEITEQLLHTIQQKIIDQKDNDGV